jgi:hypothetical protein
MANPQMYVEVVTSGAQSSVTVVGHGDDVGDAFGDDEDFVIVLNSSANSANTAITGVLEGTPVTNILAVNSAILSNTTTDGDILFAVSDGGTSKEFLFANGDSADLQIGHGMATVTVKTASGDLSLSPAAGDINIPVDIGLTFGNDGEKIEGDGTNLAIASSANLSIDAGAGSAIRLNDARANVDVVIESDAADNLFHADATLGAVAINTAASGTRVFEVGGSFTSTGQYFGAYFTTLGTIVGSNDASHLWVNAGITGASGATHDVISTARFEEPAITVNSSTINHTATVYITGAAHEAGSSQNYALWVDAGESRFDGDIGAAATRVPKIWTTNQDTTNAENVSSWSHVKENINAYTEDALAILRKASVVSFSHVTDIDPSGRIKLGLLADSIDEPLAAPMGEYELGYGTGPRIDMMGLAALAVRSIQELADRVDSLELKAQKLGV